VAGKFMVGRLVDVAEDELDVRDIPDARVRASVHQLRAVEIHADDVSAGRRGDEREPPFAGADIQDELSAKVLMPELVQEQRTERGGLLRRLPPWKRATHAHDVRNEGRRRLGGRSGPARLRVLGVARDGSEQTGTIALAPGRASAGPF